MFAFRMDNQKTESSILNAHSFIAAYKRSRLKKRIMKKGQKVTTIFTYCESFLMQTK